MTRRALKVTGKRVTVRLIVVVALLVTGWGSAIAQEKAERRKQSYTVSEYAFKKLAHAHELLSSKQYSESREVLDQLHKSRGLNAHEVALVYQTYAYIAAAQERYDDAAVNFEKCLAQQALPHAAELDIKYNLAQLYLATEKPGKAVDVLEPWLEQAEKPSPVVYYLLALAYFQQEKRDLALPPARQAVESSDQPKEAWMQLLLSLYLEEKSYAKAAPLLEKILARFPKKSHWMQLAAVYTELGREEETLAVTELVYTQGLLNRDRELRNLAQLYLYHQIPYRAARVLESGIEDERIEADEDALKLLADSWLRAREYEKAIAPLERAARISGDGDLYLRLGQVYLEREEWLEAANALEKALQTNKLDHPGRASLLLGIANSSRGQIEIAQRAFERAQQYQESRKSAAHWLKHIEQRKAQAN